MEASGADAVISLSEMEKESRGSVLRGLCVDSALRDHSELCNKRGIIIPGEGGCGTRGSGASCRCCFGKGCKGLNLPNSGC